MIKIAMINIHGALKQNGMDSKMLLQVHDELVFEAPRSEAHTLKTLVVDLMKSAMNLKVPIEVEAGVGDSWYEAH
jgi:DNA polymerase-1